MISRIHLGLPNAYKLMCFHRNINGNRDVKFLGRDYLLVQQSMKLTLILLQILYVYLTLVFASGKIVKSPGFVLSELVFGSSEHLIHETRRVKMIFICARFFSSDHKRI